MNATLIRTSAAVLLVLGSGGLASANYTYNISANLYTTSTSTTLAGTLTGSFTTNGSGTSAGTTILSYSITDSGGTAGGFTAPAITYTTANSSVTSQSLPQFFQLDGNAGGPLAGDELRIYFTDGGLTLSGATISQASSYEFNGGFNRFPGGTVTNSAAVPEPASIALTSSALVLALGVARLIRARKGALVA